MPRGPQRRHGGSTPRPSHLSGGYLEVRSCSASLGPASVAGHLPGTYGSPALCLCCCAGRFQLLGRISPRPGPAGASGASCLRLLENRAAQEAESHLPVLS